MSQKSNRVNRLEAIGRKRRSGNSGPAELKTFLRRLPVIDPPQPDAEVAMPVVKEAKTWNGPRVAKISRKKFVRRRKQALQRANRGAYSGR